MNARFLDESELADIGLAMLGENVLIHESVVIVGAENISIGSHVRIDPYCIISAGQELTIGSHVHLAAHVLLSGGAGITLHDFSGISHGAKLLSASDDFTAAALTGPTVPLDLRAVIEAPIVIGRHAIVGANSVILPGTRLAEGSTVGALSLARGELEAWKVHAGIPAKAIGVRDKRGVLRSEAEFHSRFFRPA